MNAKRVLITGGTGFVGANLVRRLRLMGDGHEVHLALRPNYQAWRIADIRADLALHEVQLSDAEAALNLVQTIKPNWIFHLAAHGAYSWQTELNAIIQTNFLATVNLVQAALHVGVEAFVNTGSSSEYGYKNAPHSETDFLEPNSHYAVTKAAATLFCQQSARSYKIHMPTLRLYSVYGAYEDPQRLMPTLVLHALRGELPPLANPTIARDYVYIEDVLDAYLLAAQNPNPDDFGAIYNVGTGHQSSLADVVETAQDVFKLSVAPNWGSMPNRAWDTSIWVADNARIGAALGWRPRVELAEGLQRFGAWFEAHPEMKAFYSDAS